MAAELGLIFVTETKDLCPAMRSVIEPIFYLGDLFDTS
jgi:hypothetical protein